MLTLLAAAAMMLPQGEAKLGRDARSDMPREVMESNLQLVWYRVFVDTDGAIKECRIRAIHGSIDDVTPLCSALMGKKVHPGVGPDGMPIASYMDGAFNLSDNLPKVPSLPAEVDVTMQVETWPEDGIKPVRTKIIVMVGPDGHIRQCLPTGDATPEYSAAACANVEGMEMPRKSEADGQPIAYLYPLTFEFTDERL